MCVVTDTIVRVAREIRMQAERLENRAACVEAIECSNSADESEAKLIARNMRRDAEAMRASAKLLDGKA